MAGVQVSVEELRAVAGMLRGLQGELDRPIPQSLLGGSGTPEMDDGYFTLAAHCGSRMRHLANDIEALARVLDDAAEAYAGTDQNIAMSTAGSSTATGKR